jgi:predicted small secreted protein
VATITTTIDLDDNTFSFQIDSKTGKQTINLNKNLTENYGLENVEFERTIDQKTGEIIYQMKPAIGKDGKLYELITDPTTGSKKENI